MFLEIHDNEVGNSLMGVAYSLDYEYQAEMHVIEQAKDTPQAVRWILFTEEGSALRIWERNGLKPKEIFLSEMPKANPRALKRAEEKRKGNG